MDSQGFGPVESGERPPAEAQSPHPDNGPERMDTAVKNALLAILRPLIRYLIQRGLTYPVLIELLKQVYFTEAEALPRDTGAAFTNSRISLLTGLHRKDVRRLRAERAKAAGAKPSRRAGLAARLVAEWVANPRYVDATGKPRSLRLRETGTRPSFEDLAKTVKADMRAKVILDELLRAGVARLAGDRIELVRNAYVPAQPRDKLNYLGANVGDHLRSALHNVGGESEPFVERAVYYGAIRPEDLERLRPELARVADTFLRRINKRVMPLSGRAEGAARRMRLGVYYYEDDGGAQPATRRRPTPTKRRPKDGPGK